MSFFFIYYLHQLTTNLIIYLRFCDVSGNICYRELHTASKQGTIIITVVGDQLAMTTFITELNPLSFSVFFAFVPDYTVFCISWSQILIGSKAVAHTHHVIRRRDRTMTDSFLADFLFCQLGLTRWQTWQHNSKNFPHPLVTEPPLLLRWISHMVHIARRLLDSSSPLGRKKKPWTLDQKTSVPKPYP